MCCYCYCTVYYSCNIEKSYLVDVKTKLYIATDSNPSDVHTYELCSDLVDVVIDVSYIYGVKHPERGSSGKSGHGASSVSAVEWATPYDEQSASAIRLNSGMVLYLREVSELLALVCIMREEYFFKRSLLDYNIDCLRVSLGKVMRAGKGFDSSAVLVGKTAANTTGSSVAVGSPAAGASRGAVTNTKKP